MGEKRVFGLTISDIIDNIVDHNSVIALWEEDENDPHNMNLLYRGQGWQIPDSYLKYKFVRIYSAEVESIELSDVVNIECEREYNKKK